MTKDLSYWSDIWLLNSKGACKYYISTLGVGGEYEGIAYFAYVVRGSGGSRGNMLILLILIHLKMAFKSVKYHLTFWSKAIYGWNLPGMSPNHVQSEHSPGFIFSKNCTNPFAFFQ